MKNTINDIVKPVFKNKNTEWKAFLYFGIAYSLLILVVPLAVQFLIGNLFLQGLHWSLMTVIIFISAILALALMAKYAQLYVLEILERRVQDQLYHYFDAPGKLAPLEQAIIFEIPAVQKSLGKWALDGFGILLTLVIGLIVLVLYHPIYILIAATVPLTLYWIFTQQNISLETAYNESKAKYQLFGHLLEGIPLTREELSEYFNKRSKHFDILKKQVKWLLVVQWAGQISVIFLGSFLFSKGELSLGQFVASEIIATGVFNMMGKLATFLETHYSLVLSLKKLESIKKGGDHV